MTLSPKAFLFPSVAAHAATAVLFLVFTAGVATIKSGKKSIRVTLTAAAPRAGQPMTMPSQPAKGAPVVAAPTQAPPEPRPEQPKPKPEQPKPKSEQVKPKPDLPKPTPDKPRILDTPKEVIEKQKLAAKIREQKRKDQLAKQQLTNRPVVIARAEPDTTSRPKPVKPAYTPQELESQKAFTEAQDRFAQLAKQLQADREAFKKNVATVGGVAIGNEKVGTVTGIGPGSGTGSGSGSGSGTGSGSGSGSGSGAGGGSALNDFMTGPFNEAIQAVWNRTQPKNLPASRCVVKFTLSRDGKVSNVSLEKPSGVRELDQAAVEAVKQAQFPAFTAEIKEPSLEFLVPFELSN